MSKPPIENFTIPAEWLTVEAACELVRQGVGKREGVGYVLGDGLLGVDLDACVDDAGELHEIARDALELRSYAETSPRGEGLHVLIRGTIPRPMKLGARDGVPSREIYDRDRYFTVTGRRIGATAEIAAGPEAQARLDAFLAKWFAPKTNARIDAECDVAGGGLSELSDGEVFAAMFRARNGAKWRALVEGNWAAYPSQSEADLALVSVLRYYTRANSAQIDRLFRKTGLLRAKWDERRGARPYGDLTIAKVIARGGPVWSGFRVATPDVGSRVAMVPFWVVQRLKGAYELPLRAYAAIAIHADADSVASLSVSRIAELCEVSERSARAAIAKLKRAGVLAVELWSNQPNRYHLHKTPALTLPPLASPASGSQDSGPRPSPTCKTPALTLPPNITTGGGGGESLARACVREECSFFIGDPKIGEPCKRCAVPWLEHDGIRTS
jgi:hypothetical protein